MTIKKTENLPVDMAVKCAHALDMKKAENIVVLDLRGITILADFFILASGFAQVQIQAYANAVAEETHKMGIKCHSMEGYEDSSWILMDYSDVIVHLMTEESRDYYRLERLWGDAPQIDWQNQWDSMEKP